MDENIQPKISEVVQSASGIGRVEKVLKNTSTTEVKALFWQIPHASGQKEVSLKLGRYKKGTLIPWRTVTNEITLSEDELMLVIDFITENYRPIKAGESKWLPVTDSAIKEYLEKNPDNLFDLINLLDLEKLENIESLVSVARLDNVLKNWNNNKDNSDEEFWQKFFQEHSWILSQIFSCPFILIGTKTYCGGKEDNNRGGIQGDFLYQNDLTGNLAFVEIKTPKTDILGNQYRGAENGKENVVYSMSGEVSGGINQVLNQRKTYLNTHGDNNGKFLHNAKCILIIGKVSDFKNEDEKKSFELFRSSSKEVKLVTFDELFGRIDAFLKLLKNAK